MEMEITPTGRRHKNIPISKGDKRSSVKGEFQHKKERIVLTRQRHSLAW